MKEEKNLSKSQGKSVEKELGEGDDKGAPQIRNLVSKPE